MSKALFADGSAALDRKRGPAFRTAGAGLLRNKGLEAGEAPDASGAPNPAGASFPRVRRGEAGRKVTLGSHL
jgi:hypothetical protein